MLCCVCRILCILFIYLSDCQEDTDEPLQCWHGMLFILFSFSHVTITYAVRQIPRKINYFYFQSFRHNPVGFCIATNTPSFIDFYYLHVIVCLSCVATHAFRKLIIYLFACNTFVSGYSTMHPFWVELIIYLFIRALIIVQAAANNCFFNYFYLFSWKSSKYLIIIPNGGGLGPPNPPNKLKTRQTNWKSVKQIEHPSNKS